MKSPREGGSEISFADVLLASHRYAPIYDWVWGAVLEPGRRELARVASSAAANGCLLEVGVGTGLMLPKYSTDVAVTGVDITEEMLARAQGRARQLPGRDIELKLMDGEKLAFPDGSFDCVVLAYVLSVTPDPRRLLAEVRRVCRKNGVILLLNHFNGSAAWWLLERIAKPLTAQIGFRPDFSFEEHVLRNNDLNIEEIRKVNVLDLSRLVIIRNA
jgi:phosphatidylethanolamine/phosphatidyl-N-methylethanolamine N-methyltransferase